MFAVMLDLSLWCLALIIWDKELMNSFPHYGAECPCRDKVIKML